MNNVTSLMHRLQNREAKLTHKRAQAIKALLMDTGGNLMELMSETQDSEIKEYLRAAHSALDSAENLWRTKKVQS